MDDSELEIFNQLVNFLVAIPQIAYCPDVFSASPFSIRGVDHPLIQLNKNSTFNFTRELVPNDIVRIADTNKDKYIYFFTETLNVNVKLESGTKNSRCAIRLVRDRSCCMAKYFYHVRLVEESALRKCSFSNVTYKDIHQIGTLTKGVRYIDN